jgi:hypothetical protein
MERRTGRRVAGAAAIAALLVSGGWLLGVPRREVRVSDAGTLSPLPAVVVAGPAGSPSQEPHASERVPEPAPAPAAGPLRQEGTDYRDWSASVAILPAALGGMGPSLKLGLDAARNDDMAFCFRGLERGGAAPGAAEWKTIRAADLLLYLEAEEGAVDVVDATVARSGTLPPSVVECCREVLRGMQITVLFAVPGQRYRYIYEIEE